jgi:hypothetical protein
MNRLQSPEDMERLDLRDLSQPGWETVHEMFGLSYANYLVLPRVLLEYMPNAWQLRFKALIDELESVFDTSGSYLVKARGPDGKFVQDPLAEYRHPNWDALLARRQPEVSGDGQD